MSDHPILFTGPMVCAILDGRKTQTRRVVKVALPQYFSESANIVWVEDHPLTRKSGPGWYWSDNTAVHGALAGPVKCPYGGPGDVLWVRETMWLGGNYVATDPPPRPHCGKQPSIFMRRIDSRITLRVKAVRVERVQEISKLDALHEGVDWHAPVTYTYQDYLERTVPLEAEIIPKFQALWDSINAKRGFGWDVNPWCWCIEFEMITLAKGGE